MDEYKFFNIPQVCEVNNTIFKKLFYENGDIKAINKAIFIEVIKKITWLYSLKTENTNIQPYKDETREYVEIEFIELELNEDKNINRMAEIIMRTIPYPMVLIFRLKENLKFFVAHQRNNLNDSSKNTLEEIISTDWLGIESKLLEKLDIQTMRFNNFYNLYIDIVDVISIYNVSDIITDSTLITGAEARLLFAEIQDIEQQIETLRYKLKTEVQFNRKMELNIEIKKLEHSKNILVGGDTL